MLAIRVNVYEVMKFLMRDFNVMPIQKHQKNWCKESYMFYAGYLYALKDYISENDYNLLCGIPTLYLLSWTMSSSEIISICNKWAKLLQEYKTKGV